VKVLRKGEVLFRIGDSFDRLFMIRSGAVKATLFNEEGSERIAGFYLSGELVGLDAIADCQHVSTAVAIETTSVCVFMFASLIACAQHSPDLHRRLWRKASQEILARQKLAMEIGHTSADARVAGFLLTISRCFSEIGLSARNLRLPMSRQDIAVYLGLTVETVCRVLTRLQDAGLVSRAQREIVLEDMEGLASLNNARKTMTKPGKLPAPRRSDMAFTATAR
jgi:CRP/FNR family transcriptional regulator